MDEERLLGIHSIALETLRHAEKHGDITFVQRLAELLPDDLLWKFSVWVRSYTPIVLRSEGGRISSSRFRKGELDFGPFAIDEAGGSPFVSVDSPSGSARSLGRSFARERVQKDLLGRSLPSKLNLARQWFEDGLHWQRDGFANWKQLSELPLEAIPYPELTGAYVHSVSSIVGEGDEDRLAARKVRDKILSEWAARNRAVVTNDFFYWRTIRTPAGIVKFEKMNAPAEGMLAALGYHVGIGRGLPSAVRQHILDDLLCCELPPVGNEIYMRKWARPTSADRLKQLNVTLANLGTNERGRGLMVAPQQRAADLSYLYSKYYIGGFSWEKA